MPWPGEPDRLAVAVSAAGVWLTDDHGETWRRGNHGIRPRYLPDDAGQTWNEIGSGLPSDFGFPLALDPSDPDSAYVIPLTGDFDRVTPEGHVCVYETHDGGVTWTGRGDGLPRDHAYLTVLRRAFDRAGEGCSLRLYFGVTSGDVFGSGDAGGSWFTAATRLPPVFSVSASV